MDRSGPFRRTRGRARQISQTTSSDAEEPVGAPLPLGAEIVPLPAPEADALRRARRGDQTAFNELVAPLMQPAYHLALRLLGDRELAEDVTQEALVKAWLGLRRFRGDARFSTWVFRIVHNACTDALRQRARHPRPLSADWQDEDSPARELVDPGPSIEEQVAERDARVQILAAVDALPSEWKAVVILRDVHGLSYEEIAVITGQQLGSVKSRLHRARGAVRAALGGDVAAAGTFSPPGRPRP